MKTCPRSEHAPLPGGHIEGQVGRLAHPVALTGRAKALRSTAGRRADAAVISSAGKQLVAAEVAATGTGPRVEFDFRRAVDSFEGKERR